MIDGVLVIRRERSLSAPRRWLRIAPGVYGITVTLALPFFFFYIPTLLGFFPPGNLFHLQDLWTWAKRPGQKSSSISVGGHGGVGADAFHGRVLGVKSIESSFLRGSEPNAAVANSIPKVGCAWQDQGWLWRQGRGEEKTSPSGNVIGVTGASSCSLCFPRNMGLQVETLGNVPCSARQVRQGQGHSCGN